MARTKHRAIRAAVAALLRAGGTSISPAPTLSAPALKKGLVFENRVYRLAEGVISQIHVNYTGSDPDRVAIKGAPIDWTTSIELLIRARREGDTSAEDVADEAWADVYARLMADQTLGGLAAYLDPGSMQVIDDQGEVDVCQLLWNVQYRHDTANNSIT
jgi:hypothetical protein